jgi:alcohol dehydrogenase class IV
MMRAANLAGQAINISRTTASHAMAYGFTITQGIPHGHAVALTLSQLMELHDTVDEYTIQPGLDLSVLRDTMKALWQILGVESAVEAGQKFRGIMKAIGLEQRLSRLGIDDAGLERLKENPFDPKRASNNPRVVTMEDYIRILENVR